MLLFHLLPCHENAFYNHANVCIGSVEYRGKMGIAISQIAPFLCAMHCQDSSEEID